MNCINPILEFFKALLHWSLPERGPNTIPKYLDAFHTDIDSHPGQCCPSHSLTTKQLAVEARGELRIMMHVTAFKSRPETHVKSSRRNLTMGKCLSWLKAIPISSTGALTQPRGGARHWFLSMCNKGLI